MADDFKSQRDVSLLELFNQSGYREVKNEITEELIESYLNKNSNLVQSWLTESEDTRGTPAWYISSKNNIWIVGFYPGGEQLEFNEINRACACYVKRYMESLSEL